jgi:hypothetical protein
MWPFKSFDFTRTRWRLVNKRAVYTQFDIYVSITITESIYVPNGIIRPVDSVSALAWVIRYIHDWNLQFLNDIIIIKTTVPSTWGIGDLSRWGVSIYIHIYMKISLTHIYTTALFPDLARTCTQTSIFVYIEGFREYNLFMLM